MSSKYDIKDIVWKDTRYINELSWWLTNKVYLVELLDWQKVVVKIWNDLTREAEFFGCISKYATNTQMLFPKLLDQKWNDILIIEYKEGINWKDIVDDISENNRYHIWKTLGQNMKILHDIKITNNIDKLLEIEKMIDYLSTETKIFDQNTYNQELTNLKDQLQQTNKQFVLLHGDFSPHNCLFIKDNIKSNTYVSAILDPSGRVWRWINYFDITYLMNTRWNKNKIQLKKWFEEVYKVNQDDILYTWVEKIMKMYLAEIYNIMWDQEGSKNILNTL